MLSLKDKVTGLMVFFLITASQVGVGVLGFQSIINKYAGNDAWLSVIVAGLMVNVLIWVMYRMLKNDETGDIISIHNVTYGNWLGAFFTILFVLYLVLLAIVVLQTYAEIIQVWMFPHLNIWAFLLLLLPLIYYTISDQFRIVVGVCFLGVVYPASLIFTMIFPLQYADMNHIMPVMDHTLIEIVQSSKLAIFSFMGFSTLLVYYPFIREADKSQKYAHYGNFYTTILYVLLCVVTFLYYNQSELTDVIWPTLGLWKIIELPFMERFEYFGIATLFFSTLPNVVLYLWAATRVVHRTFGFAHKRIALILLGIVFIVSFFIEGREEINFLNDTAAQIGFVFLFIYIPLLFVLNYIKRKVQKK
ncbi:spore germination protein (amino acid permease) [Lentibacillus persicus]|uniref:Spore germination protein (Amino acid permease) n=1 Tax=Lentibacillus persicus TaxID=640948 RepID=A0A1I1SRU6_9BACI|nr:GerAB/ArcD/ProY family transporter [Lentibacillus persicus]SFD45800.1 spore germination protein (amino acid permease) [Lentibacillus persicus]